MHSDTEKQIFFYEREFYFLSNYSSFALEWKGELYMTSEHVYHSEKFEDENLKKQIKNIRSAHDSHEFAETHKDKRRKDWDKIKLDVMKEILRAKAEQHLYIKEKLLQSSGKELIENSPLDSFWGWGPDGNGENHLGKLWMEIREEFRHK